MKHGIFILTAAIALAAFLPRAARADAQGDLQAGTAALAAGEFDKALTLLSTAAQALPQSVEAQLALAECQLKLGQVDEALAGYRAVLKLSPDHALAKRVAAALTSQQSTVEQQLASARALMTLEAYSSARGVLTSLYKRPLDAKQRAEARLLDAEVHLWSGDSNGALALATEITQVSSDASHKSAAQVIVAFALLHANAKETSAAKTALAAAGEVAAPWNLRAKFVQLLIRLDDDAQAPNVASEIGPALAAVPGGALRSDLVKRVESRLLAVAHTHLDRGERGAALSIVWPMVSDKPAPGADQVLKPVDAQGGWSQRRFEAAHVLASIGRGEFQKSQASASLLGLWLAAEVLRQSADLPPAAIADELHTLAASLPAVCQAPSDRKPGEPLSRGDELQRAVVLALVNISPNDDLRQKAIALLVAQLDRYKAANDLAAGLARYFVVDATVDPPMASPVAPLDSLPLGLANGQLLLSAAMRYAELGAQKFQQNAASLAGDANTALIAEDAVALVLCARVGELYPDDQRSPGVAQGVIDRYIGAHQWDVAHRAAEIYYARLPGDVARWARIELKLRQIREEEDGLLAVNRALPQELNASLAGALKEIVALVNADPAEIGKNKARNRAVTILESLTSRYASLPRVDLAESVVAAVVGDGGSEKLVDWGLWTRANLLEQQAAKTLGLRSAVVAEGKTLALDEQHKAEIALLSELIEKHPDSPYIGSAFQRVLNIAQTYETYRSFDTARAVLTDFLAKHPTLARAEELQYASVRLALTKAQQAFEERSDADKAPREISAEYAASLDALAAFLKTHRTGQYASRAENDLLAVMRTYGAAGGWSVARTVLARFTAAVPDYREPLRLKLLEAATYLGELDRQYGLSLLSSFGRNVSQPQSDGDVAIAMTEASAVSSDAPNAPSEEPFASNYANPRPGDEAPASSQPQALPGINQPGGRPDATALAMIEQSQRRQMQQIAMYEQQGPGAGGFGGGGPQGGMAQNEEGGQQAIAAPSGPVLSEAEMKRQDEVADTVYALLLALAKEPSPDDADVAAQARAQILWLFGFFEGQYRADHAVALIERYLKDKPDDQARLALAFRAINDRLHWAAQPRGIERVTLAWLDERETLFDEARTKIDEFIAAHTDQASWVDKARMLRVDSYDRQSQLAARLSTVRAGGLLVQSVESLLALLAESPDHPQASGFSNRLWNVAQRLRSLGEQQAAIYVLSQIPIHFPVDALASQAVLTIAEIHAANLSNPLQAVETYQEYLHLNGDSEQVRTQIFSIAQHLAAGQRYLEALHVYGVFVDSFPEDPRASGALKAIGEVHQANEVWEEAIVSYERVLDEYPNCAETPSVRLAIAECQINLSEWKAARRIYEDFSRQYPQDGQVAMAQQRIQVLKNLDRYQTLLADKTIERNKDDAQYQIGRIVREQLGNNVKAVAEFRKVVSDFPKSDLADDAQLEVGRSLLALGRTEKARDALLEVPLRFPNSPVADDALYLIGQSYEQQANRLASVSAATVLAEEFERNQRGAYQVFNDNLAEQKRESSARRDVLKSQGKAAQLDLEEAAGAFRLNQSNFDIIANTTRQAQQKAASETALQVANRQDRINEALREAVAVYSRATGEYPLGDMTDESLLRIAQIYETELKDRDAAMKTYQRVVELFPGTPVAEDAAWKLASFYEQEGKYTLAADAYRDFIRKHPASGRVADAQFALAEVYEQLGKWVEAMDAYEVFRQKFAQHAKAQLASEQINWIKAYRK